MTLYASTIAKRSPRRGLTGKCAIVARRSVEYRQGVKSVVVVEVIAILVEKLVLGRIFRIVLMLQIGEAVIRFVLEIVFIQSVTKIGVLVPHNPILTGSYTRAAFPDISRYIAFLSR
jgi:hypothetical protein